MIILGQYVETTWVGFTKEYYMSKGYKFTGCNTKFLVKVEDLLAKSNVKILVKCDYCNKEYRISLSNYTKSLDKMSHSFCKECGNKHFIKFNINDIKNEFFNRNYTLLSTEYISCTKKLDYICNKHPEYIQSIRYDIFKNQGCGCFYCGREEAARKNSGSNNKSWKGGITSENNKIRTSKEMDKWKYSVFKRDSYTCQRCNRRGGDLNAHHILNFAEYPNLRFDIKNGATLCVDCHSAKIITVFILYMERKIIL